jgi:hypothetical protein
MTPTTGWTVNGNSGTNPTASFIGTTDAQDLVLRTNNTEKVRVLSAVNTSNQIMTITGGDAVINDVIIGRGNGNDVFNTTTGNGALIANTVSGGNNGKYNSAFGYFSLNANTTGFLNSAFGYKSLQVNTTGRANTGFGAETLRSNTTGLKNTAIGNASMYSMTTGSYNTAMGSESLYNNTTGSNNVAIGVQAHDTSGALSTSSNDVAVGFQTLYNNTSGGQNTALGYRAGFGIISGGNNTLLGSGAGIGLTTGANNTIIGANMATLSGTSGLSNNILIADGSGVIRWRTDNTGKSIVGSGISAVTTIGNTFEITHGTAGNSGLRFTNFPSVGLLATDTNGDVVAATSNSANGLFWGLGGNSGTAPATNFIGTTDTQPLVVKTNNIEAMRVLSNGNIGIGTTNPGAPLAFANTTGNKVLLFNLASNDSYGFGIAANKLQIFSSNASSATTMGFGFGDSGSFNEKMTILNGGNVGIGAIAPGNKLEITHGTAGNSGLRFTNLTSASTSGVSSGKVLSVDSNGDVVLENTPTSTGPIWYSETVSGGTAPTTGGSMSIAIGDGAKAENDNMLVFGNNAGSDIAPFSSGSGMSSNSTIVIGKDSGAIGMGGGSGAIIDHMIMIGTEAGNNTYRGDYSVNIGYQTGGGDSYGGVFIGPLSGNQNSGAGNTIESVFIGSNASSSTSVLHSIALGTNATATADNQFVIGGSGTGNYGGGTTGIDTMIINATNGNTCTIDVVSSGTLACTSDERRKTNISDLSNTDTLSKLLQVRTVSYNWKTGNTLRNNIGFLAQDLEKYFPEVVITDTNGWKAVSYGNMTPMIISAIKELSLKVDATVLSSGNTNSSGFFDALKNWLGNAGNGLENLFTKRVETNEFCITDEAGTDCYNRTQLKQLIGNTGGSTGSTSDNSGSTGDVTGDSTGGDIMSGSAGTTPDTTDTVTLPSDTLSDTAIDQTPDSSGSDTVPVTDTLSNTTETSTDTVTTE